MFPSRMISPNTSMAMVRFGKRWYHHHHHHHHHHSGPISSISISPPWRHNRHPPRTNPTASFSSSSKSPSPPSPSIPPPSSSPGSLAFVDCEFEAVADLFTQFANHPQSNEIGGVDEQGSYLCHRGVSELLTSIGETTSEHIVHQLFQSHDVNQDGRLHFDEFLLAADSVLGEKPAGIILVVGGPGSGKGMLCDRLAVECGSVHLSSGELLRDEVQSQTPLGKECAEIMKRGELVSSEVMTALLRRRMRLFPKRRVLLDGFPRSLENAHDFIRHCGKPEVALHLDCDDTILMERILYRAKSSGDAGRADDNFETALTRLRTFHKFHHVTLDWLREQGVPIVNLDCSGTPQNVWNQLVAIGRLMRPVVAFKEDVQLAKARQNPSTSLSLFGELSEETTEETQTGTF